MKRSLVVISHPPHSIVEIPTGNWSFSNDYPGGKNRLPTRRSMEAAKQFFRQALATIGHAPERVTTDGHDSYPRAIREALGNEVMHRWNAYLNNHLEQDLVGSNSAITRCVDLETSPRPLASAGHLTRYASSFGFGPRESNMFPSLTNVISSANDWMP